MSTVNDTPLRNITDAMFSLGKAPIIMRGREYPRQIAVFKKKILRFVPTMNHMFLTPNFLSGVTCFWCCITYDGS